MGNFRDKTISGISWSIKAQVFQQFFSIITSIILARLLTPNDFGLIAMITVITGFAGIFVDMGFGSALIQKKEINQRELSSVFWFNLVVACLLTLLFVSSAHFIAAFYHEPLLIPLTFFISLNFMFSGLGVIQKTLLTKEVDFKTLFKVQVTAQPLAVLVAIIMAWRGYGPWSIATQMVLNSLLTSTILWWLSKWKPTAEFHWESIRDLMGFSMNLFGNKSLNYWVRNLDNLLIGKFIGTDSLGIYSRAYKFLMFPLVNISQVISRVLFPSLSQIQDDKKKIKHVYLMVSRAIALVAFPILAAFFVLADPLVIGLFGEKWSAMIPILKIFAILGVLQSVGTIISNLYLSQGRADLMFRVGLFLQLLLMAAIIIGLRWGIIGVAIAYTIATFITSYINHKYAGQLVNIKYYEILRNLSGIFFTTVAMGFCVYSLDAWLFAPLSSLLRLILGLAICFIFYVTLLTIFNVKAYTEVMLILLERLNRNQSSYMVMILSRLIKYLLPDEKTGFPSSIEYWKSRSKKYGARAVLNLFHAESEMDNMTKFQIDQIFPFVKRSLNGSEKLIMDFGCGPGRFSEHLANLVEGKTIAVDPIENFIHIAPKSKIVDYRLIENNRIPIKDGSIDLAWICLVLGGIRDEDLGKSLEEIRRVLKPDGLMCLIENTSDLKNSSHWYFRSVPRYQELIQFCQLRKVHEYQDVGETISVLIGRVQDTKCAII